MANRHNISRHHSPLVNKTWHHSSNPAPVVTAAPITKGFSPLPCNADAIIQAGDCSWSGDWKQLFADSNSSDWPSQSAASSTSWSDELENETSRKLSEQYDILESSLYGDSNSEKLSNPNLALECKQWRERFPHLRALGVAIKDSSESLKPCTIEELEDVNEEEVIASHGTYDNSKQSQSNLSQSFLICSPNYEITEEDVEKYRDKLKKAVLDQIFSRVWPDVVKRIEPVFKKLLERNKLSMQPSNKICLEGGSMLQSGCELGFSKIDQFLRVSPVPMREITSPKKSVLVPTSPAKSAILDCQVSQQVGFVNLRNSTSLRNSSSNVKLVVPAPIIFPSAEKLLSPIPPESSRNGVQSARIRKKVPPKSSCASGKNKRTLINQSHGQDGENGRFCAKYDSRTSQSQHNISKKTSHGYWNRHGMLPPISSKENLKTSSAATQRSTSALLKLGKPDVETRPNTSLPNKNGVALYPLNECDTTKKKSRIELAQQWLEKQLNSVNNNNNNNYKHHVSTHVESNSHSRWRAHQLSHRK